MAGQVALPLPRIGESAADLQVRLAAYNRAILQIGAEVYHEIFLAAAAICMIGLVVVVFLRVRQNVTTQHRRSTALQKH